MKKACVLFLSVFTLPAFASGINSTATSAPCTNNTLETYSGNTNLQADWAPNEIQLRWYNGNTLMDVQSSANTCVYDGTLTIPQTAPTRTGYTFDGWTVRPEMDFATIPNVEGTERWARGNNDNSCWHGIGGNSEKSEDCNLPEYSDLSPNEWKVQTSYGIVYGAGYCSAKSGNNNNYLWTNDPSNWKSTFDELENASGNKTHCWCLATGYRPINNNPDNIQYKPSATPYWIYCNGHTCSHLCASYCANYVLGNAVSNFRLSLYGAR